MIRRLILSLISLIARVRLMNRSIKLKQNTRHDGEGHWQVTEYKDDLVTGAHLFESIELAFDHIHDYLIRD